MTKIKTKKLPTIENKRALQTLIDSNYFAEYVDFIQSPWKTFIYGFLRGTGFAFGAIAGVTLLVALIAYIIQLLSGVPVVGDLLTRFGAMINIR